MAQRFVQRKRVMPGKKAKTKRALSVPKPHTSFNNPSEEVIKDDENVKKQKKVRRKYTSETESTNNNDDSENESFNDDDNNSDSTSVSNDTNNEEYGHDDVTEIHDTDKCEGTVETSRKSDEMSSITNSLTKVKGKNIEELLSIVKQQEQTITSLLNERGYEDGYMMMNPIQETNLLKTTKFELFRYVQFIRHDSILENYTSKNSIGAFVMNQLGVDAEDRCMFWKTYRHVVRKGIKVQRNITHSALKKQFLSK